MKRNFTIMLIIAFMAVLATGCSQDDNSGDSALKDNTSNKSAIIEPGQLISAQEAEELTGAIVADVQTSETEAVGQKLCFYEFGEEGSGRFLQVSLNQQAFVPNNDPGLAPKSIYEALKGNFQAELVEVEGIGEEAFIATPGIHILHRDYYITIAVGNTSGERNIEILKAAGTKAVENLDLLINK